MRRTLAMACILWMIGAAAPPSSAQSVHPVHKTQKPTPEPPSSTTPVQLQPAPAPIAIVSYQNGLLTITAENARLSDIIDRIRNSTGAAVDTPPLNELVTVHLGPQPPAQVIAALLEGSHLNYVIVGGVADSAAVRAIQLMPEPAGPETTLRTPAVDAEAAAAMSMAKALFIAQTGGDEGVWDNAPESPPPVGSGSLPAPSNQPATQ